MGSPAIFCKFDEMKPVADLKEHPKNRNRHGVDQINRLAKLYSTHGIRHPIIISKLSGFIVSGHARRLAAIEAKIEQMPVVYQDFKSEEAEYGFLISDNGISDWSFLDLGAIASDIKSFGDEFDIEVLGMKNFTLDLPEDFDAEKEWKEMPEFDQPDATSFRHVIVHFQDEEAAKEFFETIGHPDTGKTKSIWFPPVENKDTDNRRYG